MERQCVYGYPVAVVSAANSLSRPIHQTDARSGDIFRKSDRNQIKAFNLDNHRHIWTFLDT